MPAESNHDIHDMEPFKSLRGAVVPAFETHRGSLFQGDCISLMPEIQSDSIDLVFADPPFNLGKRYPSEMNDSLMEDDYLQWSYDWTSECARILKPGGSFFLFNLPRWNLALGEHLRKQLTFRNWIAIEIAYRLPIQGRLYPSHYSLLYYVKGAKPAVFKPDRLPMETCRHCHGETKDYGGYKDKMNPLGINLSDVWSDIPPVRHAKFKRRVGSNELSIKLLDRVIRMASEEGHLVFDPFGGSGTTYAVAEILNRRWIGMEIGPTNGIIERLHPGNLELERRYLAEMRAELNHLFPPEVAAARIADGMWVPGNIPHGTKRGKKAQVIEQPMLCFNETADQLKQFGRKHKQRKYSGVI
ncbi:MAG: site-specific DNA-methyltransferase [Opitutaceae bacterium]|jgi:site-specific DNA-methyltransferase (adenine-specific)